MKGERASCIVNVDERGSSADSQCHGRVGCRPRAITLPTEALARSRVTMDVKLFMFREDGTKREFSLVPGVSTIGRKTDCSIRIPLGAVSRRHAEIVVEDTAVVLRDLGAANGTYVNTKKIEEEKLEPGDQIMIGPIVFTVQIDGKPSDSELVKIKSNYSGDSSGGTGTVGTSKHVYMSDDEVDPISALEALASSADQTVIDADEEDLLAE